MLTRAIEYRPLGFLHRQFVVALCCDCRELCCALHLSRVWPDLGRLWSVLRQSDTCFRSDALRPDDPPTAALITIDGTEFAMKPLA